MNGYGAENRWSSGTRPGTSWPFRRWPAGCSRSASSPLWPRTWRTAGLAARSARWWQPGRRSAWPAVSLVGTFELVLWIIRASAARGEVRREPPVDQPRQSAGQWPSPLHSTPVPVPNGWLSQPGGFASTGPPNGRDTGGPNHVSACDQPGDPTASEAGQWYKASDHLDRFACGLPAGGPPGGADDVSAAAVAAYRASIERGAPLSERKLAAMFGKTSRRWARNRMTESGQRVAPVPYGRW